MAFTLTIFVDNFHFSVLCRKIYFGIDMAFQVEDDDKLNGHSSNQLSARPYLCTGYDIYLVWEPCTM